MTESKRIADKMNHVKPLPKKDVVPDVLRLAKGARKTLVVHAEASGSPNPSS
jgi:hypothetical protein